MSSAYGGSPAKVLLVSDGAPAAALAAQVAADVCTKMGSELHILRVPGSSRSQEGSSEASGSGTLYQYPVPEMPGHQCDELAPANVAGVWTLQENRRPAKKIARLALNLGVGLLVIGSSRPYLFASNVSASLARLSSCPLLVVRASGTEIEESWPPTEVVVGVDLSVESEQVAVSSAALASALSARLSMVFAYYRFPEAMQPQGLTAFDSDEETKWYAWRRLDRLSRQLEVTLGYRPHFQTLAGEESCAIRRAAEEAEKPALIAVGTRRLSRTRRALLGSVSSEVIRSANGPVLVIPPLGSAYTSQGSELGNVVAESD